VREQIAFHPGEGSDEVLQLALEPMVEPESRTAA
jgi:hypothetical protein